MFFPKHIILALCLLSFGLIPSTTWAQKRKAKVKAKASATTTLPSLPTYTTTEHTTDTTWMLSGGVAFELNIHLQLPSCDECPTQQAIRQWYKARYAELSNAPHLAEAQLQRFALDATPTIPAEPTLTESDKKKKRKSRKERRAEAKRLAANTVTNKTPRHSLDIDVERLFENGYIATYRMQVLTYAPHSAGEESNYYLTINKHTGQPLQWSDLYLSKQRTKFVTALAGALQRYYNASDWKALAPHLRSPILKPSALPLPQSAPVIVEQSLYAVYTSGELTTTDAPTLIVDTQWLKGTLTPTAISYFK